MFQLTLFILVGVFLNSVASQNLPVNPCPNLFKYIQNNGIVYGRMDFQNDYSGNYRLAVNMSVATYVNNQNIRLELLTSSNDIIRGAPLRYLVYFPVQNVLPKPTAIEFNNRIYCSAPPEELRPGRYVSNMWATTYFMISIPHPRPRPNTDYDINQSSEIPFTPTMFTSPPPITSPTPTPAPTRVNTVRSTTSPTNVECGVSSVKVQQLIVNGENIQEGHYPWLVAMMYRQNFDYKYRCTGSLVSTRHVVTAGHCIQYFKAPLFPIGDLVLVLGKTDITNWANGAVIRDVANVQVHPDYEQNKGDGDIAVMTVNKDVEFQPNIKPICLWQEEEDLDQVVNNVGTVIGWGRDDSGREFVAQAKKVSMPIVSQVECLRSDPRFSSLTSSRTFCAGRRDGSGPCTGDSGAGFIMNRNGKWTLRGVVSRALGDVTTCDLDNYFVFVDVAKIREWLNKALK